MPKSRPPYLPTFLRRGHEEVRFRGAQVRRSLAATARARSFG